MRDDEMANQESVSNIRGFNISNLGFDQHEVFMKVLIFEEEAPLTTSSILRIHILRLWLLFFWSIYDSITIGYRFITDVMQSYLIIYNVLSINFQVEKFIQLIIKLIQLIFINIDQTSLNAIFEFFPKPDHLPNSITLVLKMNKNKVAKPPPIPKPYLDYNKNLVNPNEWEVNKAISLQNEFLTQQRLFIVGEKYRLLNDLSKFILWSSFANMEFINIFESSGILWSGNNQETVEKLQIIREIIICEFNSQLKCSNNETSLRNLLPIITLIDLNSGYELEVAITNTEPTCSSFPDVSHEMASQISPWMGRNETSSRNVTADGDIQDDAWIDEFRIRQFKVYFSDKTTSSNIRNLPMSTDLIMIPNVRTVQLFGYRSSIENNQPLIFSNEEKFNFKYFIKALNYFASAIAEQ